jgi:hypothetical protein
LAAEARKEYQAESRGLAAGLDWKLMIEPVGTLLAAVKEMLADVNG